MDKAISTSKELRVKVEELTNELKSTKNSLGNTQNALLEVEDQLYVAKQFREQENRERAKEIKQVIEDMIAFN
jgi:ribosomal protein L17